MGPFQFVGQSSLWTVHAARMKYGTWSKRLFKCAVEGHQHVQESCKKFDSGSAIMETGFKRDPCPAMDVDELNDFNKDADLKNTLR